MPNKIKQRNPNLLWLARLEFGGRMKDLLREVEFYMKQAVEDLNREFRGIQTSRASLAFLDTITVPYEGTLIPLSQLANLSLADATAILVQPHNPATLSMIAAAIRTSGLGLAPVSDGNFIRISFPPSTEEQRREKIEKAHNVAESTRNGIRLARRDGNEQLKKMLKNREISEDEGQQGLAGTQKLHDQYIDKVQKILQTKEQEILS